MTPLLSDTSPAVEQLQIELLRQVPVSRKMEMLAQLNAAAHQMALVGLRQRYPLADRTELRRRLAGLLLGETLATKVYGELAHAA